MNLNQQLEQLLPLVTKPGRYIGGELNSSKKTQKTLLHDSALLFPILTKSECPIWDYRLFINC